jgi:hypothetical protein
MAVNLPTGLDDLLAAIRTGNTLLGSVYDKLCQIEAVLLKQDDKLGNVVRDQGKKR